MCRESEACRQSVASREQVRNRDSSNDKPANLRLCPCRLPHLPIDVGFLLAPHRYRHYLHLRLRWL